MTDQQQDNEICEVDVGGRIFKTTRTTLCRSSWFKVILSADESTIPFIDRDPDYFAVILNYLRSGRVRVPKNLSFEQFKMECDYFLIHDDCTKDQHTFLQTPYLTVCIDNLVLSSCDCSSVRTVIWSQEYSCFPGAWHKHIGTGFVSVRNPVEACKIFIDFLTQHGFTVRKTKNKSGIWKVDLLKS
jgi:hypothetical protein